MSTVTTLRKTNAETERDAITMNAFEAIDKGRVFYRGNPHNFNSTLRLSFEEKALPKCPKDLSRLFGRVADKLGLFGKVIGSIGRSYTERDYFSLTVESDLETIAGLEKKSSRHHFHEACREIGLVNISSNRLSYSRPAIIAANDI